MFFQVFIGRLLYSIILSRTVETRSSILTFADKLEFIAGWEILLAILMIIAVMIVALHRYWGTQYERHGNDSPALTIKKNFLQNSLEQSFINILLHLGLLRYLDAETICVIPCLIILFLFARVVFYIGYMYNPPYRAFGFGLSVNQHILIVLYLLYQQF